MRFQDNPLAGGTAPEAFPASRTPATAQKTRSPGSCSGRTAQASSAALSTLPRTTRRSGVWRDTSIANGGALDIAPGILGYEWNTSPDDEYRPAGLIKLSETTIPWSGILIDQGNTVAPGIATHNLSLYRADSGALVFGAGTVFWTWALSDKHDS